MTQNNFKNKKVLIMGLGKQGGGVEVTKWFAKQGAKITVTDLKTRKQLNKSLEELNGLKIKYVLGKHRIKDFTNQDLIIQNPAVPRESPYLKIARKNKIPIETDISIFFELCAVPIIGITGTKGKSTVMTILGKIFKDAGFNIVVAGNIGKSPLSYFGRIKPNTIVILELSSWQLESLAIHKKSPHIALITNITKDHLNRYKSFQDYIAAKKNIFKFHNESNILVLNADNKITKSLAKETKSQVYWFSKRKPCVSLSKIKLQGEHNIENILAAATVALIYKIPKKIIHKTISEIKKIESRLELVKEKEGIKYYNDTTATTPEAAILALKTLKQNIILIAGGVNKKLSYKDFAREINKRVKYGIFFEGDASALIKRFLPKKQKYFFNIKSMKQAVSLAKRLAQKGDKIVLSPAAASFNMFQNEFDRGKQFVKNI